MKEGGNISRQWTAFVVFLLILCELFHGHAATPIKEPSKNSHQGIKRNSLEGLTVLQSNDRAGLPSPNKKSIVRSPSAKALNRKNPAIIKKNDIVGNTKDELPDFISHALGGHHDDSLRWMDFYNNGATWDHFRPPTEHSDGYVHEDHGHYKVNLAIDDMGPYGGGGEHVNNMVEAYPGEIVSGENSLSKYIAPPVYDSDSYGYSRHKVSQPKHGRLKYFAKTPEQQSTEKENTKRLMDSLNSLMTPLKTQENSYERKVEKDTWGGAPDENAEQINRQVEEDAQNQHQKAVYEQNRLHESPSSRDNFERMEQDLVSSNFNGDRGPVEKTAVRDDEEDGQKDDRERENGDTELAGKRNSNNLGLEDDYKSEYGDERDGYSHDDISEPERDDVDAKSESSERIDNDGFETDKSDMASRKQLHGSYFERAGLHRDMEDEEKIGEETEVSDSEKSLTHKSSPKPIEVVEDESGKFIPLYAKTSAKESPDTSSESGSKKGESGETDTGKDVGFKRPAKESTSGNSEGKHTLRLKLDSLKKSKIIPSGLKS